MTHLYIELNTGLTEEVNSSIISKLYELAISGDLDETSDLKGRLHSTGAKEKHVTYLNNNFDDLYISADALYLSFEDPDVETYMKRYIGTNEGVTSLDVLTFVNSGTAFGSSYTNTHTNRSGFLYISNDERASINTFDEFNLFNGITSLGNNVFNGCSNLTSIQLPSSVVRLNTWTFSGCTNLSSINLNNIQYIGGESFKSTKLSGVIDLPNIIQIGDSSRGASFVSCTRITEVNVGSNFTTFVNESNFAYCTGLTKITGLSNLTSIPGKTFYNCNVLSSVDIDWNKITNVESLAFMKCNSLLFGELDLSTVTTIPQEAFRECYGITKLLLGNNTTIDGSNSFYRCTGITEANLGSGMTFAENAKSTFWGCTNLTTVTGLSGITTIPVQTFYGCTSLSSVDIDWSKITSIGNRALSDCPIGTGLTIELNLTNQSSHFGGAFERTKFDKIIVHCNWSGSGDSNHTMFSSLPYTTYIDASDCILHTVGGYSLSTVSGDNSLVTVIYPPSVNQIRSGTLGLRNALGTFKYMIILNTTPPDINIDHNNPFSSAFSNSILHIYVPDSALSDYLADSKWSQLGGDGGTVTILLRLHGLSELPAGVWTTGLASQYLTPAQLVTT